jgi:hypothetical protein
LPVPYPSIHHAEMSFWVYILASRPGGTLYVGVTRDLIRRIFEHRNKLISGFTKRYGVTRLGLFRRAQHRFGCDPTGKEHQALASRVEDRPYRIAES